MEYAGAIRAYTVRGNVIRYTPWDIPCTFLTLNKPCERVIVEGNHFDSAPEDADTRKIIDRGKGTIIR